MLWFDLMQEKTIQKQQKGKMKLLQLINTNKVNIEHD